MNQLKVSISKMLTNLIFLENRSFMSFNPKVLKPTSSNVKIHASIKILSYPNTMQNVCRRFNCTFASTNKEVHILCKRFDNRSYKQQTKKKREA
jgi:hypothetical protein